MCFNLTKMNWKIVFIVLVTFLLLKTVLETSLIIISNKSIRMNLSQMRQSLPVNDPQQQPKIPLAEQGKFHVLLWNNWYGNKWIDSLVKHPKCEFTNCVFSDNRAEQGSSDAIVFHWWDTDPNDLPEQGVNTQKLVLYNLEPPQHRLIDFDRIGLKKIDWIMSYRTDSDIYTPYGKTVKCNTSWEQKNSFENKTKSIAWFVSNCKTRSNRETYVQRLGQYIDVDIYGGCGSLKCHRYNDSSCKEMIANQYKFYLSFENSVSSRSLQVSIFINSNSIISKDM